MSMIGRTIAHYAITEEIGRGGMGEVYLATDTKLKRKVALKVLSQALAGDEQHMARLTREAEVLASLDHPNIGQIYGMEAAEGSKALVLQFIEGPTLADRIALGPMTLDEALPIALQIAEALEAAHEKGIIHRDLKPANIKITSEGIVKVLDFGLAKALDEEQTPEEIADSPTLTMEATQAGIILGTAAYMGPEQARGRPVDRRADIWAFGVVLFEMLAGRQPFAEEDLSLTLAAVMKEEPAWEKLPKAVPARIGILLERCLEKNPRERLQAIGEARISLTRYLSRPDEEETSSAQPTATMFGRRPNLVWSAVLLVAVIVAGFSGWLLKPEQPAPDPIRLETNVSGEQPLYANWGNNTALSPDGKLLAFVGGTLAERRLYLRSLDRLESEMLPETELASSPFFSPDGLWLGFFAGSAAGAELKKVPISGGTPSSLCAISLARGATWGTEGTIVFGRQSGGLMRVLAAGGTPRELTRLEEGEGFGHVWPQFLPGGRHVLFTSYVSGDSRIEVVEVQTGKRKVIHEGGRYPRYVASRHLLYVDGGTLLAAPFDLHELEVTAEAVPVLQDVGLDDLAPSGAAFYEVSEEGTLVYLSGSPVHDMVWVNRKGEQTPLSSIRGRYDHIELSPDGKQLAVQVNIEGDWDIWLYDLDRDVRTPFTFSEGRDADPVWSPDGKHLIFSSEQGGEFNLYQQPADGSGQPVRLTESVHYQWATSYSRDGRWLAYVENHPETGYDLWFLPMGSEAEPQPFLVTQAGETSPEFSPDGRWVAYMSNEGGRFEIFVRSFPDGTGKLQISRDGGWQPRWSSNGAEIFYSSGDKLMAVSIRAEDSDITAGNPRELLEVPNRLQWFEASGDGQRFAFVLQQPSDPTHLTFVVHWFEELRRLVPRDF